MNTDKTLKTKELIAMMFLFIGIKMADSSTSLLTQYVQNAYWLILIVSLAVILPPFFLLLHLLKKHKDKNLIELLEHIFGSFLGKVVGLVIFLISFILMIFDSRNYIEEVKLLYFPESPTTILFFIFLFVCFFGAKRGFETIGVTSWMVLPFIMISMSFLAFLIFGQIVWQRIFPLFGSGLDIILIQGVKKSSLFSEFFILTIAYTSFKNTDIFQKGSKLGYFLVSFQLIFFFLLYTLIFDYNSIEKVAFPFHDITQYVNFGDFFTNVETFFMVFWLSAAYLRFIIYLYLIAMLFGAIFHIKEYELLLLPFAFITVMFGLLTENSVENQLVLRETLLDIASPLFISLPFVLWIVSLIRGRLKKT